VTTEPRTPGERRSRYPKECGRDLAVCVINQNRTVVDVACQSGIDNKTLRSWMRQEGINPVEREGLISA